MYPPQALYAETIALMLEATQMPHELPFPRDTHSRNGSLLHRTFNDDEQIT
jgi:hypothetical protein